MKQGMLGVHGDVDKPSKDSNLLIIFSCKAGE